MVKFLCSSGADINAIDLVSSEISVFALRLWGSSSSNWSAMHFAAANEHDKVIEVLLSFKANVNLSRKDGVCYFLTGHH
jgi:ankyrin repeat protein